EDAVRARLDRRLADQRRPGRGGLVGGRRGLGQRQRFAGRQRGGLVEAGGRGRTAFGLGGQFRAAHGPALGLFAVARVVRRRRLGQRAVCRRLHRGGQRGAPGADVAQGADEVLAGRVTLVGVLRQAPAYRATVRRGQAAQ